MVTVNTCPVCVLVSCSRYYLTFNIICLTGCFCVNRVVCVVLSCPRITRNFIIYFNSWVADKMQGYQTAWSLAIVMMFVSVQGLPGPPSNVEMHFWDTRCNSLMYRSWSYLTEGQVSLQSVAFSEEGLYSWDDHTSRVSNDNVIRQSELVAAGFGAAWFVNANSSFTTNKQLWLSTIDSYEDQFLTSSDLVRIYGFPWYRFEAFELFSFYRRPVEEVVRPLLLNLDSPADLHSDARQVIFSHVDPDSKLIRTISLFEVFRKSRVLLNVGSTQSDLTNIIITSPFVSSDWVVYTEFDVNSKKSQVWIEDTSIETRELALHPDLQTFWGSVWNTSSPLVVDGGDYAAVAFCSFLLSEIDSLQLINDEDTYRVVPLQKNSKLHVTVMLFPSRFRCEITYDMWSSIILSTVSTITLVDYLGGGGFLFLSISYNEDGQQRYGIIAYPIKTCIGEEGEKPFLVPNSVSLTPIKLVTSSYDGVIFATANVLFTIKVYAKGAFGEYNTLICRSFDEDFPTIGAVSLLNDQLIYQKKNLEAEASYQFALSQGSSAKELQALKSTINEMLRMDLDKDNDRHWDAVDRFPLRSAFFNDSDNDGIGMYIILLQHNKIQPTQPLN